AHFGELPTRDTGTRPIVSGQVVGRAILECRTIHVPDILAVADEYPDALALQHGHLRTILVSPLLREDVAIGAIIMRRSAVRPFTDKQMALLETFASQAVIAIENVRLFTELEARNAALTEPPEQQPATSE